MLLAICAGHAQAAPGDLDRSLSDDGRIVTDLDAGSDDQVLDATVDPKGRLLLAGYSFKSPDGIRSAVARYLPNGALDPSFGGGDGIVLDNHSGGLVVRGIVLDSSGRIVLAGHNARDEPAAIRLLEDGRVDAGFGRGGVVHVPFEFAIHAVRADRLGRILLAGGARVNFTRLDFGLIRLRDDGSLDPTLDGDGLATHNLGHTFDFATDLLVDGFDRIVLAGSVWQRHSGKDRSIGRFAMARLYSDGQLDASFRGDGTATIEMSRRGSFVTAAALESAANAIVAGRAAPRTGFVKVRGAGRLGKGFGKGGRIKIATSGAQWPMDLELDRSGRPVAAIGAPRLSVNGAGALVAARLRPNGRPDRSFSGDSRAVTRFGRWRATARALALQDDGKLVVAGFGQSSGQSHTDFAAARHLGG